MGDAHDCGRTPALRASDADRERTAGLLRDAAADGRLDLDELDERCTRAYAARTLAELQELSGDLVATPDRPGSPGVAGGLTVRADPGDAGTRRIVSIMGGHERRGRWRVAARCVVAALMGGYDLDFAQAELSAPQTTIRVVSLMGGGVLRFPAGVDVRVSRFAFMGGHTVRLDNDPPPPGAPVVHLRLLSMMGGTEVRQGPAATPAVGDPARAELDRR